MANEVENYINYLINNNHIHYIFSNNGLMGIPGLIYICNEPFICHKFNDSLVLLDIKSSLNRWSDERLIIGPYNAFSIKDIESLECVHLELNRFDQVTTKIKYKQQENTNVSKLLLEVYKTKLLEMLRETYFEQEIFDQTELIFRDIEQLFNNEKRPKCEERDQ